MANWRGKKPYLVAGTVRPNCTNIEWLSLGNRPIIKWSNFCI